MRFLLGTHHTRFGGPLVPQSGLLLQPPAGFEHTDLAINLKFNSALHETHRVQVFQLNLGAEFLIAYPSHRDISLTAQISLLHVSVGSSNPLQSASHMIDVIVRFPRRTKVGLSDNLGARCSTAIQIDARIT